MFKGLPRTNQRVTLRVYKAFDFESQLHISPPIKPLTGAALVGFQLRKLRLPEPKNIRFDLANASYIANLEIETVGDRRQVVGALLGKLRSHREREQGHPNQGGNHALIAV